MLGSLPPTSWGAPALLPRPSIPDPRGKTTTPVVLWERERAGGGNHGLRGVRGRAFRECVSGVGGRGQGRCESGKMAAAAVVEFQRAQSLLSTDREASIDILHSIGKGRPAPSLALPAQLAVFGAAAAARGRASRLRGC